LITTGDFPRRKPKLSEPREPDPAQLVMSILIRNEELLSRVLDAAVKVFGEIEQAVGPLPFDFTSYYDAELGTGIKRWLWCFTDLVPPSTLAEIKKKTNEIENTFAVEGKRRCNLDPGLLSLWNFVLATGKNNAHRIYLGDGIFADLTLVFRSSSYRPLDWTYPDYASPELVSILNEMRKRYKCKLLERECQERP